MEQVSRMGEIRTAYKFSMVNLFENVVQWRVCINGSA